MTRKGRGLTNKGRGRGMGGGGGGVGGGGALWGRVGTGNLQNTSGLVVIWYGVWRMGRVERGVAMAGQEGQLKCAVVDFVLIIR